jgi:hypothetical protein
MTVAVSSTTTLVRQPSEMHWKDLSPVSQTKYLNHLEQIYKQKIVDYVTKIKKLRKFRRKHFEKHVQRKYLESYF